MITQYVDLHLHSIHSDGMCTPTELVMMAEAKELRAIALADHDSVDGIDEALAAGAKHGLEVIPALELSVAFRKQSDVHLLGYYIDHHDATLLAKLENFRGWRDERVKSIVDRINIRLQGRGKGEVSYEEVLASAKGAVGRPHIGRVLIAKGVASTMEDAFARFLGPCNEPKRYFPMHEALAEIKRVGGVSVLAHPSSITNNRKELHSLIRELADMGLGGVEVFNNRCCDDGTRFLETIATELGLTMTGGSDFHSFENDIEMGTGRGGLAVSYRCVEALREQHLRENRAS
ncbi:MAG: PHP domain-containing protein [Geobacteraceae bacterium]